MAFKANNTIKNFKETDQSNPSIAFFESLMQVIRSGSNKGKLNTDIKPRLFPEREAIAETMLKTEAKPVLPKNIESRYKS